jgi:type I restriction enzyme S subunit
VSYKREESRSDPSDGLVPILRANNIQNGRLILEDLVFVPSGRVSEEQKVRQGDIVIAMSSGSPDVVGKAALVTTDWSGGFGAFCGVLRAKKGTNPELLAHFLRSQQYRRAIEAVVTGTNINNLSKTTLAAVEVPAIERAAQDAVASFLNRVNLRSTGALSHLQTARRAVERFRQSVIYEACRGRLTADWREQHPYDAMSASDQAINVDPLIETPEEWTWGQLQEIADVRGGVQKGAKPRPGEALREVPYLRVANVQRGWLDLSEMKKIAASEAKIRDLTLRPGDVLFNEGGDRDKLGRGWIWEGQIEECIHQNHVFRARLRDAGMQPKFFSWFGNTAGTSYFIDQGKQTVNLASLSMTKLRELPVPIPSAEEQAEIVRRVERLLEVADELLVRVQAASRRVERTSQAVLAKAFRGELPVGMGAPL